MNQNTTAPLARIARAFEAFMRQVEIGEYKDHDLIRNHELRLLKEAIEAARNKGRT